MKRIITLAACVAAPFFAPVLAQPIENDRVEIVRVADLDLGSRAGVRALDRRIDRAVREVCGAASDADLEGQNEVRRCRTATRQRLALERERAIAAVQQPAQVALVGER